ncbi:FkbM family methyltransferase [Aliiroseovarius sp.]|uniref:FkbM family methyltransferase n=1 Tax=Aliiroseovarius sp. TaxID=1872442 RepID=UPI00260EEDBC|nr:FkbM family methyltransferase [Aliiroseovarius sp.]
MKDLHSEGTFRIVPPDNGPPFIKSRGIRFPNDRRVIPPRRRKALRLGLYEERETRAVIATVKPDDVVVELGAGMGYMSTLMAKNLNVAQVHAYEANPDMVPYIRAVHDENGVGNAQVHNAILGPTVGEVDFYVRGNFLASSMEAKPRGLKDQPTRVEKVEMRDINAEFARLTPSVLVCDIEGAEAEVLPAADLSCLRAAIIELHPQWIGQSGVQAVFDAMHKAGLTYFPKRSDAKVVTFLKGW